jgi:hypothetical protein
MALRLDISIEFSDSLICVKRTDLTIVRLAIALNAATQAGVSDDSTGTR